MKIVITVCLLLVGISEGQQLVAQGGNPVVSSKARAREMDKAEYIDLAETQWQQLKTSFEKRTRKKDPFGAIMYPGTIEEVVVEQKAIEKKAIPAPVVVKEVSLQEAVDKFQVNGVNARKQMVMVGFRSLRKGDPVEIKHEGELFKLRIVKITTDSVVFMNTKNQETATVRLGVFRGVSGLGGGKKSGGSLEKSVIKKGSTLKIE